MASHRVLFIGNSYTAWEAAEEFRQTEETAKRGRC